LLAPSDKEGGRKVNYRNIFRGKHAILIVVHAEDRHQTLRNVDIAKKAGTDGVFLVNHSIRSTQLVDIYEAVRRQYPTWWIGVNFLDLQNRIAIWQAGQSKASGIWLDKTDIKEESDDPCVEARNIARWQKLYASQAVLFGGVAFKYQKPVRDPGRAAKLASAHFDVVTTSGAGTGEAADVGKIQSIKAAVGNHPLAIASGITPENVGEYLPFADCFLVATGVSNSHADLDPERVALLVSAVRG
jgi:predicted TIM-barrel enzyme